MTLCTVIIIFKLHYLNHSTVTKQNLEGGKKKKKRKNLWQIFLMAQKFFLMAPFQADGETYVEYR